MSVSLGAGISARRPPLSFASSTSLPTEIHGLSILLYITPSGSGEAGWRTPSPAIRVSLGA